jgi:uncharacterized protein YbaR (Trm112 family)
MRALSAAELFEVWERGQGQSAAQRALLLLALACEETPPEHLARLSIGRRDSDLLALRKQTFGPELVSMVACPACGSQLEFRLHADDIRANPFEESDALLRVSEGEHEIAFRLPTSLDLATLDPSAGVEKNRRHLLERCVISATRAGSEMAASDLPGSAILAIAQRMSELDPQADVQLALACPQCEHKWQTPLDIVSYFWSEINAWAQRILREIHSLASAYGWRETDILALSAWRRQAYLELIEQ